MEQTAQGTLGVGLFHRFSANRFSLVPMRGRDLRIAAPPQDRDIMLFHVRKFIFDFLERDVGPRLVPGKFGEAVPDLGILKVRPVPRQHLVDRITNIG